MSTSRDNIIKKRKALITGNYEINYVKLFCLLKKPKWIALSDQSSFYVVTDCERYAAIHHGVRAGCHQCDHLDHLVCRGSSRPSNCAPTCRGNIQWPYLNIIHTVAHLNQVKSLLLRGIYIDLGSVVCVGFRKI